MSARRVIGTLLSVGFLASPVLSQQPAPTAAQDRVAVIKQSLKASMAALRQYQWIETTVVSHKGEEKSNKQSRCYYGADGKVEKVPLDSDSGGGGKEKRGLRGKIVENKKEEISDSIKAAVALVKEYVPPTPEKIQAAKDAGHIALDPPDASGSAKVKISDYLKPGDSLTLSVNAAANRLTGMAVSSYTDDVKHAVALNVTMGALEDGTLYPEKIVLDDKQEEMNIAISNSGYQKVGP